MFLLGISVVLSQHQLFLVVTLVHIPRLVQHHAQIVLQAHSRLRRHLYRVAAVWLGHSLNRVRYRALTVLLAYGLLIWHRAAQPVVWEHFQLWQLEAALLVLGVRFLLLVLVLVLLVGLVHILILELPVV